MAKKAGGTGLDVPDCATPVTVAPIPAITTNSVRPRVPELFLIAAPLLCLPSGSGDRRHGTNSLGPLNESLKRREQAKACLHRGGRCCWLAARRVERSPLSEGTDEPGDTAAVAGPQCLDRVEGVRAG